MKLRIKTILLLSYGIRRLVLEDAGGAPLPTAAAGAHILLHIPGPSRVWKNAYSLVSHPDDHQHYEIIVRRVKNSRGGSAWLHDHAAVGDVLEAELPQNLFPIARLAQKHLLLSAGIGITPFLAYLQVLKTPFELHHCCKLADAPAFEALLPTAPHITLHTSRNSLNLEALLSRQKLGTHLYVCGPENFMDVTLATAQKLGWPAAKIHKESFGGATGGTPFTARLAKSGLTIHVASDQSLLDAIEAAGIAAPCLCRGGACGECELPVLAGTPDHHDHFLSPAKREAGTSIMTCVSRAKTPDLVLDI